MYNFVFTILFSCSTNIDMPMDPVVPDPTVQLEQNGSTPDENESPNGSTPDENESPNGSTPDENESSNGSIQECTTNGGYADDEGLKSWCWSDVTIPSEGFFNNDQLFINQHCNTGMVTGLADRVYFKVNPTTPSAQNCGSVTYNYRAEIRDSPSDVNHPVGTEQWWGFDYRFGDNYIPDELPWIIWQTHGSFSNPGNPMTSLQVCATDFAGQTNKRGELLVSNSALSWPNQKFVPTGIVPQAGQTINIVIHLIWGDNNTGLYQVWVDGVKVYDEQERTVYEEQPMGGYWKIGIYKWRWKHQSNVNSSASLGIRELNTSIGPLKVIKKSPGNSTYLANEYNTVKPN
ncbi:MAG: hypothetical protein HKN89_05450 [Eudoraea sp.]|nr:hypothetical protein [Eudoraea sp.]